MGEQQPEGSASPLAERARQARLGLMRRAPQHPHRVYWCVDEELPFSALQVLPESRSSVRFDSASPKKRASRPERLEKEQQEGEGEGDVYSTTAPPTPKRRSRRDFLERFERTQLTAAYEMGGGHLPGCHCIECSGSAPSAKHAHLCDPVRVPGEGAAAASSPTGLGATSPASFGSLASEGGWTFADLVHADTATTKTVGEASTRSSTGQSSSSVSSTSSSPSNTRKKYPSNTAIKKVPENLNRTGTFPTEGLWRGTQTVDGDPEPEELTVSFDIDPGHQETDGKPQNTQLFTGSTFAVSQFGGS